MALQVILILLFLVMMIGAVVVIGVDGTTTPRDAYYPDRHLSVRDVSPEAGSGDELPSFLKVG
jgi:hypothetical protein